MKTKEKLKKINNKANKIVNDNFLTWEEKYEKIFSDKISVKVFNLIHLDYCDPDTSYEEDVTAFMNAFNDRMNVNN